MARAKKKNSSPPATLHPPYFQMISEALATLKERDSSSQPAIAKLIEAKYKKRLPSNFKKTLSLQLKRLVQSKRLVKVKNSYKISASQKAENETQKKKKVKQVKKSKAKTGSPSGAKNAMKKKPTMAKKPVSGAKMKPLSQVKTSEAVMKKSAFTPIPTRPRRQRLSSLRCP